MNEALQMRPNAANIPPRNAADAAGRFMCSPMGHVTGQRCVELYRDGERVRTSCSGCAAGKARAKLLGANIRVVEVQAPAPDAAKLADLRARVEGLEAQCSALVATCEALRQRVGHLESELEIVRNVATESRPRAATVRMGEISFSLGGFDVDAIHGWCKARDISLSHLVRTAVREHAHRTMGVDLPAYASGQCKGFGGRPHRRTRVDVPEAWSRFLDSLTAKRELSAFVRAALTAYLEAHP